MQSQECLDHLNGLFVVYTVYSQLLCQVYNHIESVLNGNDFDYQDDYLINLTLINEIIVGKIKK